MLLNYDSFICKILLNIWFVLHVWHIFFITFDRFIDIDYLFQSSFC